MRNTIIGIANPTITITFGTTVLFLKKQMRIPTKIKMITAKVPVPIPNTNVD
jgi:hypothetical protein